MPRKPEYRDWSNDRLTAEAKRLRATGLSWGRVGREFGVRAPTALAWARGNFGTPGPKPSSDSSPLPERNANGSGDGEQQMPDEKEIEERIHTRDTVARLEQGYAVVQGQHAEIIKRLDALTRQPIHVETHDGRADVSCPTCGTHAVLETGVRADNFDAVIDLLKTPHSESPTGFAEDCPKCAPKLNALFKEKGYAISKVPGRK